MIQKFRTSLDQVGEYDYYTPCTLYEVENKLETALVKL